MIEQESPAKFLPAFFVDVVELGQEFQSGELPPHMTYFPPVETSFDPILAPILRRLINPMPPFRAVVGEDDMFGEARTIPVKLIEPSPQVMAVHRALVATLQYLPHSTQYRQPFRPHITVDTKTPPFQRGEEIEMGGLSIVEKNRYRGTWQVLAKIGLKGGLED